jgi:hypothetical protein
MVTELLPQPLLRLGVDEVGRWGVGMLPLLLRARRGSSARRRGPDAVRWAPQRCTNVTPDHERPRRGLGG